MEVRIFKLVSGVEIIAELVFTGSDVYNVKRPLQIHMMRASDGSPSMGFAPWCMVADDSEVKLLMSALAARPLSPLPEVATSYVENVTGLALPPSATSTGRILME